MQTMPLILAVIVCLSGTAAFGQLNWVHVNTGITAQLLRVDWSHDRLIAVTGRETVATSPDGVNWTQSRTNCQLSAVTWANGKFVAVGNRDYADRLRFTTGSVFSSLDGNTWTVLNDTPHAYSWFLNDIIWADTQFVAVGEPSIILTSRTGSSWEVRTPVPNVDGYYTSVVWTGSQYVAVGVDRGIGVDRSAVLTSQDGVEWKTRSTGGKSELSDVVWTGTLLVAIGKDGLILTSPDGITWTSRDSGTKRWLQSIAWTGHQLVAIGNPDTAVVLSSPDGITWTDRTPDRFYVNSVAWTGSRLVAVGGGGNILISPEDPVSIMPPGSLNRDFQLRVGHGDLQYALPVSVQGSFASASIFSLSGKTIVSQGMPPGREGRVPVRPLAPGKYMFELQADGRSFSRLFEVSQ